MARVSHLMGRARLLGESAAWVVAAVALSWMAPAVVTQLLDAGIPLVPYRRPLLFFPGLATLAVLGTLTLRNASDGPRSRWWAAIPALVVVGCVLAFVALLTAMGKSWQSSYHVAVDVARSPAGATLGVTLVVMTTMLRRVAAPEEPARATRGDLMSDPMTCVGVASAALWLVAQWQAMRMGHYVSGGESLVPAEYAAWGVVDEFPARMLAGAIATGWLVAGVVAGFGVARPEALLALTGLAAWAGRTTVVDTLAFWLARGVAAWDDAPVSTIDRVAAWSQCIGVCGYAVAIACWLLSAAYAWGPRLMRSARPSVSYSTWGRLSPLLSVLLLGGSAALDPPLGLQSPQQYPEAVWTEVDVSPITFSSDIGEVPLFRTRGLNVVSGTLSSDGRLTAFRAGRRHGVEPHLPLVAPESTYAPDAMELVVDREATLGDLRRALPGVRGFAALSLAWHAYDFHRSSESARARFGFLEMASRSLRARRIDLVASPKSCDSGLVGERATARRRCHSPAPEWRHEPSDVSLIEAPDHVFIRDWLVANAARPERFALVVNRTLGRHERFVEMDDRPRRRDEIFTRVGIPDVAAGLGFGWLVALTFGAWRLGRELVVWRRALRDARPRTEPESTTAVHTVPAWVSPTRATLQLIPRQPLGPYREGRVYLVADVRAVLSEGTRVACTAARLVVHGVAMFVVVAVMALVGGLLFLAA